MELNSKIIQISNSQTPILVVSLSSLRSKYREICNRLKDVDVYYAIKANNSDQILNTLNDEGCGFDVASETELTQLIKIMGKSDSRRIICLHPIKSERFIELLKNVSVDVLAVDSYEELIKINRIHPNSKLVFRLVVDNQGSDWPLTKKFGLEADELLMLISQALDLGMNPYGLTFHVGSQCRNPVNWTKAIEASRMVWDKAASLGANLSYLSLGGGLPIYQGASVPSVEEVALIINKSIKKFFGDIKPLYLSIEPGRGLIGDSGVLISKVVGSALRGEERWLYLDVGVFNGLMETIEKYRYEVKVSNDVTSRKRVKYTLAGPSCDSVDIIMKDVELPEVSIGDKLFIMNCGAYTTVYASNFNGFDEPREVFIEDE